MKTLQLASLAGLLVVGMSAWAAGPAGQVTHLSGVLSAKKTDGGARVLSVKSEVMEGDTLNTEADTYARVKFADGGEVVLRPGTQIKVESYSYNPAKPEADSMALNMLKGGLRAVTGLLGQRSKDRVSFSTNTATIGIRGTHFGALLCQNDCGGINPPNTPEPANGLHVDVAAGAVVVSNPTGTVQLSAGQFGYVPSANQPPVQVPPQQGIQVTMPATIAQNKGDGRGVGKAGDSECKM